MTYSTKAATTRSRSERGPWVMVGWLSAIVGVLVVAFLAFNMSKDPEGRAEESVPSAVPQ